MRIKTYGELDERDGVVRPRSLLTSAKADPVVLRSREALGRSCC
ncbi:hypothetical protein AB0B45_04470 [Nonomuraea sp. NPDC049152]